MDSSAIVRDDDLDAREPVPAAVVPAPREVDWRLVLLGVLIVGGTYVWGHLGRGWMPYDDGALAQSAERVIDGQLPHRDFIDVYTGGLAFMDAAAFRLLGTTLWTLRLVLFAAFIGWVPAVFYIASRFVRPLAAGGVTLLAVAWSLPNYPAAMPSWYNLFLATFGVAALLRHLEDGKLRWLVVAGLAGGLSFLVKVVGLYYVAGVLLFLIFQGHASSRVTSDRRRGSAYAVFVSASLLLFVVALSAVVRRQLHAPEFVQFVMPGALIAGVLVRNEWTQPAGDSRARFATLARLLIPFLVGVALPIVLFLVPYARTGALGAFVNGVFILPVRRFSIAAWPAPPLRTMVAVIPFALLLALAHRARRALRPRETTLLGLTLLLVLLASGGNGMLYRGVWNAARSALPVLAISGVAFLWRARDADVRSPLLPAQAVLVLSVTALASLVQFPYSAPIYFCYVAPFVALTAVALHSYWRPMAGMVPGMLVAFFGIFAMLRANGSPLQSMGRVHVPGFQMVRLALARGGIDIPQEHAVVYDSLVPMLRAHARGGYTWASPDTPEIYFLSGLRNPTRSLFEIFDDSTNGNERVLRMLDARGVTAIVLNTYPSFSRNVTHDLYVQLQARYPHARSFAPFQLRWRE